MTCAIQEWNNITFKKKIICVELKRNAISM